MTRPRWRIILPVALLLTVVAPSLRLLPGGGNFPDPWLLLLLGAVPLKAGESWRFAVLSVALLGLLRASVSGVPLALCWAGLGLALVCRSFLHRRIREEPLLLRFLVGVLAAAPLEALDSLNAHQLGLERAWTDGWVRIAWVGVFWAVVNRPARWRFSQHPAQS